MATSSTSEAPGPPRFLFGRLRRRLLGNVTRLFLERSLLRILTILACGLIIWGFVFGLSFAGFMILRYQNIPLAGDIVGTLFDLMFLAMALMLTFSSGIILYSSLFTTPEATFLLSTPVAEDRVFGYKYQGAVAFSSWAFVLLGSPILLAYGLLYKPSADPTHFGVVWYFYFLVPLYFLGFVLVPGSLGALVCLLIVNFLPRRHKQVLLLGVLALLAGAGLVAYRSYTIAHSQPWNNDVLQRLLGQVAFAQGPLMPSHWMTRGIRAAAREELGDAVYNLGLLWSTGLVLYVGVAGVAGRVYRRGFNRLATGGESRRKIGGHRIDRILDRLLGFLDPQTRLLIVKDFRSFRRDPAQWAQILIFTGLISLYFSNVRRLFVDDIGVAYQNSISLLNLCAVALLLCTYTGRFIFPALSLEGRRFWILGLLPLKRERLLWGKFAFSAVGCLAIAEFLVLLSDLMLEMPWLLIGIHVLTMAVLSAGLSGLSVGLGAMMPNFQERDPSKIAVGFGGTLNLVAGLAFLTIVIGLMATPWHLQATGSIFAGLRDMVPDWWIVIGLVLGTGLGVATVVIPLTLGAEAMRRMEF